MKKAFTVKKKEEFTDIIHRKQFASEGGLSLYIGERKAENTRVGISVTRKLGNAVVRNKAKRQVRAMVDEIYNWEEPFDSIIIIRDKFNDYNYEENRKHLERCYKRVKMYTVTKKG